MRAGHMLSALLYLQFHSLINRTVQRLKRLRQPKYLLGGIVGGIYFYFYFFRYLFGLPNGRQGFLATISPENLAMVESFGALMLLVIIVVAWVVPHQRAALAFSQAEVAFLFPAPVSRRGLIHFKLLRSQTAILFTTLLLTIVTHRFGGNSWLRAAGWWLILSTLNLHFLGSSFARTLLMDRGITQWQRRVAILGLLTLGAVAILIWAKRTMPPLDPARLTNSQALKDYFQTLLLAGPAPWLLYPFRLMVRPFLAPDWRAFLVALGPSVLVLGLHYWWVARSDVAFEEASVEASQRMAERIAAARAGNWQRSNKQAKAKRAPFNLQPQGPPAVALFWKNLISAGQAFTPRLWLVLVAIAVAGCAGLREGLGNSGLFAALGLMAGMLLLWSVIIGPQFLRHDFRQDLLAADVLKTYPMPGWQIALGEVLAPAAILTCVQWLLLILALGLGAQGRIDKAGWPNALSIGLSAGMLLPLLNLITLQIPNAAVLLFPAWFQLGKEGAHGIEATGQRLIFLLGQLLLLIVCLVPAGLMFGVGFFMAQWAIGVNTALLVGAAGAAIMLAVEGAVGFVVLGKLFERLDVAAEISP